MFFLLSRRATVAASLLMVLGACGGGSGEAPAPAPSAPTNAMPLASAGSAQSVFVGKTVTLDGSRSTDADADPLTYAWQLVSRPAGSTAALIDAAGVKPTFTADMAGDYVFRLVVNDGKATSEPAMVTVFAAIENLAPVADAGTAQNVFTGSVVSLDGTASTDANGDPLTYAWVLTTPPGSTAALDSDVSAAPHFTPDIAGTYVATLMVSDGRLQSSAATVTITATVANVAPVANAGTPQTVAEGSTVTLDGSSSTDANGDALTYLWSFTTRPGGSAAVLSSTTAAGPTFTADVAGTYVLQLIVNDGQVSSTPGTVTITVYGPPTANAGADVSSPAFSWTTLDGSASTPAAGVVTPLTYLWSFVSTNTSYGYVPPMNGPTLQVENTGPGVTVWQLRVCQGALCSTDQVNVITP